MSNLPNEILESILSQVDFKTIVRASTLCKQFNKVVKKSSILERIVELGVAGLIPNPAFHHVGGHLDKIRHLKEDTRYWHTLDLQRNESYYLPSPGPMNRMLLAYPDGLVVWKSGLITLDNGQQRIDCLIYFLLRLDGFHPLRPITMVVPHALSIVTIDPGQDLVVASSTFQMPDPLYGVPTVYIHFLKFDERAGEHPLAVKKRIAFPNLLRIHSAVPQIIGDIVSVASARLNPLEHAINVIQWKRGVTLMNIVMPNTLSQSFTLLSEDKYLFVSVNVHAPSIGDFERFVIEVGDVNGRKRPMLFMLPDMGRNWNIVSVTRRVEQCVSHRGGEFMPNIGPNLANDTPKLLVFVMKLVNPLRQPFIFKFVALTSIFTDTPEWMATMYGNCIPWSIWAEKNTRLLNEDTDLVQACGYRATVAQSNVVLDFNPYEVGRDIGRGNVSYIWKAPNSIVPRHDGTDVFTEVVNTTLPYRVIPFRIPTGIYQNLMVPMIGKKLLVHQELNDSNIVLYAIGI